MVDIKRPSRKSFDHVDTHVVFVHGLEGDIEGTWTSGEGSNAEFWLQWLEEDVPNVAVWSVGYLASRFKWNGGIAMAPEDRAEQILQRLLAEPGLANGTIILVGHSMGGVIIKEMLRLAETQAATDQGVASFERRVRKAAFIATPHQGSWMSSVASNLGFFFRPSAATAALGRNNRHLAALNTWFRNYATGARLAVVGFGETLRTRLGQVVLPDSSDLVD
ncbi:esterase/lipase family protein [Martelella soudanensis]|uniref:esterase/lipase family protein n=1 Tax=unclassified Martelella TaxID=2629616 RepID=UPI0015DEBB27|nr:MULTISPECIES: alpha/beta fold hydrolase [unclassified Martelella]